DVVKENGGLTIKKFVGVDKAVLTVPAELGGLPVRVIDTGAFCDCKYIEKVIISEGILAIRNGAFADCPNLRSVVLPSTLKSFGNDSELKQSTSQQAVFHNCRLQSIEMPPAIINIGERAFYNCDLLKDIMLPDGLEVIGDEAFWGCTSLTKVRIPKSVQTIGKDAFKTKGEGNRKRNLNITLYCYGGSAGLEYARANNLAYKDAEELE
ncbi:MAG: leucine-rich repeat domain-containing protein, partial [Peptococcaceae bacterium]|nr:leucine-rich repeat domain-containing protein [Peptococcaceae bacterium]